MTYNVKIQGIIYGTRPNRIENPNKSEVNTFVDWIGNDGGGWYNLYRIPELEFGPYRLEIVTGEIDNITQYFVIMSDKKEDGDLEIRAFTDLNNYQGQVEMMGHFWHHRGMINDKEVLREILLQFCENGDVSRDLLD